MSEHQASRTLLKSPPELWTECSDAQSLARHLGEFGEIRITRLEPETAVAWEGDRISGTVRLEPSGWGTKVTLTVAGQEPETAEPPDPAPEALALEAPEPAATEAPAPTPQAEAAAPPEPPQQEPKPTRPNFMARVRRWFSAETVAPPSPLSPAPASPPPPEPVVAEPEPAPQPEPAVEEPERASEPSQAAVALTAALDSLGKAHHRPFSRA